MTAGNGGVDGGATVSEVVATVGGRGEFAMVVEAAGVDCAPAWFAAPDFPTEAIFPARAFISWPNWSSIP